MYVNIIALITGILFIYIVVGASIIIVGEKTTAVIERFGKFQGMAYSGLGFRIPFIDRKAGLIDQKLQQMDVVVETKTLDNVFVKMEVSVQYIPKQEKLFEAFYSLSNPKAQINSYVKSFLRIG